ncbi:MAG: hypothetical protein II767_04250, partial [Proteobacteria bacterium]|nr:hypothetical protein [Pseudomonadota bacterium]
MKNNYFPKLIPDQIFQPGGDSRKHNTTSSLLYYCSAVIFLAALCLPAIAMADTGAGAQGLDARVALSGTYISSDYK